MTNKMTNKELFAMVISVVNSADIAEADKTMLVDFLNSRVAQIDKKANTVSKAAAAKAELNNAIANDILSVMVALDKPVKVSDLIRNSDTLSGYSTQKLTPIMTKLVADGKIVKSVVKREAFYSLV